MKQGFLDKRIAYTIHESDHLDSPLVIFVHGWMSNQNAYYRHCAEHLHQIGYTTLTFDLPGHGMSAGSCEDLKIEHYLDDAALVYDHFSREQTILVGASFGAYLAARLCDSKSIAGLVLRSPANYPDQFEQILADSQAEDHQWRMKPLAGDATHSLRAVQTFQGPLLVVESEHDEIIPHQTVANYLSAAPWSEHQVLSGAGHSLHDDAKNQTRYLNLLCRWLEKNRKNFSLFNASAS